MVSSPLSIVLAARLAAGDESLKKADGEQLTTDY